VVPFPSDLVLSKVDVKQSSPCRGSVCLDLDSQDGRAVGVDRRKRVWQTSRKKGRERETKYKKILSDTVTGRSVRSETPQRLGQVRRVSLRGADNHTAAKFSGVGTTWELGMMCSEQGPLVDRNVATPFFLRGCGWARTSRRFGIASSR
jgi:hypothetical protein